MNKFLLLVFLSVASFTVFSQKDFKNKGFSIKSEVTDHQKEVLVNLDFDDYRFYNSTTELYVDNVLLKLNSVSFMLKAGHVLTEEKIINSKRRESESLKYKIKVIPKIKAGLDMGYVQDEDAEMKTMIRKK